MEDGDDTLNAIIDDIVEAIRDLESNPQYIDTSWQIQRGGKPYTIKIYRDYE